MSNWQSERPTKCGICRQDLQDSFVDGSTTMGMWAIMCKDCHKRKGVGLGIGRGQEYSLETLKKIAG